MFYAITFFFFSLIRVQKNDLIYWEFFFKILILLLLKKIDNNKIMFSVITIIPQSTKNKQQRIWIGFDCVGVYLR